MARAIRHSARDAVRTVRCPRCGAEPDKNCWGRTPDAEKGLRLANHKERVSAYNPTYLDTYTTYAAALKKVAEQEGRQ